MKKLLGRIPAWVWAGLIFVGMTGLLLGSWAMKSHFEASSYNRATGSNVSTWDAMWIELRVQAEPKR